MFRVSKVFLSLLLLIACSCSSNDKDIDEDLFLGSGDTDVSDFVTTESLSVTAVSGGNTEFEHFEHFFNITRQLDTKTEGCEISASTTTNELKTCLIEVNELDLFVHGLELEINVPPGMCKFLARDNYWYYNYEAGRGPISVRIGPKVIGGDIDVDSDGVPIVYCEVNGESCDDHPEVKFEDEALTCVYDYSVADNPNCCFGNYNLTTVVATVVAADPVAGTPASTTLTPTTTRMNWGGDFGSCASGPGMSSEWTQRSIGSYLIPERIVTDVRANGAAVNMTILAPIDQNSVGNVFAANYYKGALDPNPAADGPDHPHYHESTRFRSKLPVAIQPLADRSGDELRAANDAYRVLCLDEDYEVLQQINVYIREWNTLDKYQEYTTSFTNTTPEPDVEGVEGGAGSDCGYFTSESDCNDAKDWDDIPGEYPN